ncbi:MAG: hypothetical protein J7L47_06690 [Candidatus Odinarchaeota archaeon]|nr:hypothetical protein [Candidatus Odinarchaeota archaeon]
MERSQGYDVALTLFNPQGRIQQLEYVQRVIDKGHPIIGMVYNKGVILIAYKKFDDKLIDKDKFHKIVSIDDNLIAAFVGMAGDARVLIDYVRAEAQSFKLSYDRVATPFEVCKSIADLLHTYTFYAIIRPFAVVIMVAGVTKKEKQVVIILPGGMMMGYKAWSVGRGAGSIREALESGYREDMSREETLKLGLKALRDAANLELCGSCVEVAYIEEDSPTKAVFISQEEISKFINSL